MEGKGPVTTNAVTSIAVTPIAVTRNLAYLVCFVLLAMALPAHAGAGVIGMALSNAQMQVDQSTVNGNVNLSPGATLSSSSSLARIRLSNGARAALAPYSAAAVFSDRLVLRKGTGTVFSPNYQLESLGMTITTHAPDAQAQVSIQDATIRVQALHGDVRITAGNGMVLARVRSGSALEITPGAAESSLSTMSGILRADNGRLLLKDSITNLDVELTGTQLHSELGRRIEVTGSAQPSPDRQSQLIQVARWNRLDNEATPSPVPAPEPKSGEPKSGDPKGLPGTQKTTGISLGAKIAIAGAVGAAIAGGAAYAAISR